MPPVLPGASCFQGCDGEMLPDREAMSLIAPFVTPPEITLPLELND
jgi:hypothetical protein